MQVETLEYRQRQGLNSILPLGLNHIEISRPFTTSEACIFVPFATQELEQEGGSWYYQNKLSNNLVFGNRANLASPVGFISGKTGSGKGFFAKNEIEGTLLSKPDDQVIIFDRAGEYKLLIEPIAYFTHNGQYYCMTATEAGLYDQMSGGNLRKTMTSLTHKNLPLSMFLEFSDLGISAWTGSTTGKQNNSDIISTLGVGIVWFDEAPPEGEIEAPDVEYRVDTDVITAVTLRTDQDLTPDNPASVTFHILGTTYRVNDIVIPAGDSQVVWVKWHTPSTPQTVTITVSVSGAYTAQDTFVAKIVDLNEHIPPDPVATDTNPGYSVPPLPSETQKLTANWGVWSCYWVPVWVWCDHGEDGGHWVDEGYWEYEYTGYSASISGEMSLMPDDIVPTASGKTMKSGYGVKTEVRATLSTDAPTSHITYPQTAFSVFPEFQYQTYLRLLQRSGGQSAKFIFKPNEFSTYDRTVHFTPLWFPDATDYTIYTQVWDTWTPDGMLSINLNDYVSIQGSLYDDWYTNRE